MDIRFRSVSLPNKLHGYSLANLVSIKSPLCFATYNIEFIFKGKIKSEGLI